MMQTAEPTEYCESSTTTLEWTVKSLKSLFDTSKGELKSKVTKSVRFGGGCVAFKFPLYINAYHSGNRMPS